jgi:hypothetical protein
MEVPLIDGLLAVIAQSSALPLVERPLHRLAGLISGSGGPFVLRYREIGDCVDIVRDLLEGSTDRERAPWTSTPGASLSPDSRVSHGSGPRETRESGGIGTGARVERVERVERAPWVDAVHGEEGTLVLVGESQVRLGPVGEVVWGRADRPLTVAEAQAAVVQALGQHPDAERVVTEGVAAMLASGVLRLSR